MATLTGTTSWTFDLSRPSPDSAECTGVTESTVTAPSFTKGSCTADASVVAPDTLAYSWNDPTGPIDARVYQAVKKDGYTLTGTTSWTFDLSRPSPQSVNPVGACYVPPAGPPSPTTITLSATVENQFGGKARVSDFTLTATGQLAPAAAARSSFTPLAVSGTTFSGITGSAAITNAVLPAGTYSLSVSALPQGYSKSAWACNGGAQNGAEFTVRLGQSVSCNIIILDSAASVTSTFVTPVVTTVIPPVVTPVVKGRVTTKAPVTVDAPVAAPAQVTELAFTGAETLPLSLSGLFALLLGAGLILVSRRRTTE